jgi:hypothetical protein
MQKWVLAGAAALLLAGCDSPAQQTVGDELADCCGAEILQKLMG